MMQQVYKVEIESEQRGRVTVASRALFTDPDVVEKIHRELNDLLVKRALEAREPTIVGSFTADAEDAGNG